MKNYHSFDFLKNIYFVRTGGSIEEEKASNLIKEEIERLGGTASIEEFLVDASNILEEKLVFDGKHEIECKGSGYSGNTNHEGVTGEIVSISSIEELKMTNLCNKIILTPGKRVQYQAYMKAIKEKALGFITTTGDVYKNNKDVDLDPYLNREPYYKEGYIPTVMIRMKDAERILASGYKTANLTLITEDLKRNSRNVVAEIKGEIEDEINNTKKSILEFLGFFAAILALVLTTVQIAVTLSLTESIKLIGFMLGGIIVAFGTLRLVMNFNGKTFLQTLTICLFGVGFVLFVLFIAPHFK